MCIITIIPEIFEKGKEYNFTQIEKFCSEDDYELTELGSIVIGSSFIILTHNNSGKNISFVLSGYNTVYGNLYECIYTDLK